MNTIKAHGRTYDYIKTIGKGSPGGPGFRHPVDITIWGDVIFALNRGTEGEPCGRIGVFNFDEDFLGEFSSNGEGDGQFVWGTSIVRDKEGLIYLADEWLNRISIFNGSVKFNGENIGEENFLRKWGTKGSAEGQLNGPAGLSLDRDGNIYVTENMNHRVSKFTADGNFILSWGKQGNNDGEFNHPWGITVDDNQDVYVADWKNHRIQKFTGDGVFIQSFGTDGTGKLNLPSDVAVDKDGDVYAVEWWDNKVQVYDAHANHLTTLEGNSVTLSRWAQDVLDTDSAARENREKVKDWSPSYRFFRPTAIEIDDSGRIYIVEDGRWRIQIYQKYFGQ